MRAVSHTFHNPCRSRILDNHAMVILFATCALLLAPQASPAPAATPALSGIWTLNKELSDADPPGAGRGEQGGEHAAGGRAGGHRGGGGGGGYGGRGMGRGGGSAPAKNPDEVARMRDAVRDVMQPSERLTIVQTGTM